MTKRISVDSSAISWYRYLPRLQLLEVEYKDTKVIYRFWPVEREVFEEFISHESLGKYLRLFIANGTYNSERIN